MKKLPDATETAEMPAITGIKTEDMTRMAAETIGDIAENDGIARRRTVKKLPDATETAETPAKTGIKTEDITRTTDETIEGVAENDGNAGEASGNAGSVRTRGGEPLRKRGEAGKSTAKSLRALKTAAGALGAAAFLFVAVCFIVILFQLFSGKEPSLFGYRFYYILTDSMSPTYEPKDVVLSREFPDEASKLSIEVGDVVTFIGNTGDQNGKTITHRVVKAPYRDEASGRYFLTTKGDKEGAPEDAPVPLENVRAAAVGKSRFVGFLYRAILTPVGYVFLIVVPVCILIALLILKMIFDFRKKKREDAAERERTRLEQLKKEAVEEFLKQKKNH